MNKSCTKCQNASVRVPNKRNGLFNSLKNPNKYKKGTQMKFVTTAVAAFLWLTVGKKISSVLCTQNNQSKNNPKNEQIKWNRFAVFVLLFAVQKEILEILLFILSAARALICARERLFCQLFIGTHVMWDQQLTVFYGPPSVYTHTHAKINMLMIQLEKLRPNPFAKKVAWFARY